MQRISLIFIFIFTSVIVFAQSIKTDKLFMPLVSVNIGLNKPGGDFADRFGYSGQIGASFIIKLKSNWLFGLEGDYLYSQKINNREYHDYLMNSDGWITNMYGDPGIVSEKLGGFTAFGKIGKILPFLNPNPNSGFLVQVGLGFMQHKIWIEQRGNNMPQLTPEYIKGYDRLCNGLMMNQFIGYMFFHEKALRNFYCGIEVTEAYTQNRRSWDFIQERKIDDKRHDYLFSFKLGWTLSLHKRMSNDIYYF